jgi:hypothetical protein
MAERIDVEVTVKSKYEVAESMASTILISIEGRSWGSLKQSREAAIANAWSQELETVSVH